MARKRQKNQKIQKALSALPMTLILTSFFALLITLQSFEMVDVPGLPTWSTLVRAVDQTVQTAKPVVAPVPAEGEASVHFIDVGQGNSTLILGDTYAALIDAGEWDQGQKVVDYLERCGVKKLDYVIASHPHADHIGGLRVVFDEIAVETVVMPQLKDSLVPTTKVYEKFVTAIENNGCSVEAAQMGAEYSLGEGAVLQVLGPSGDFDDLNNMSIATRFRYGRVNFNIMADMENQAEEALLNAGLDVQAKVMALGHHGSKTSNSQAFLDAADATYYIAQMGYDNSYGHPHNETVRAIMKRDGTLLRSDTSGNIVFLTDGEALRFEQEKKVG